jgi:hypothetical protein
LASSIGIKIANGEFYPILSDSRPVKKRMVLTTVHDGQESVQIDLYQSQTRTMSDAKYIGTLVVEKLKAKKKGEPSVELILSRDNEGDISAEAKDLDNPNSVLHPRLSISSASLSKNPVKPSLDDVRLEDDTENEPFSLMGGSKNTKLPLFVIAAAAVLLLVVGLAIWFFVIRDVPSQKGAETSQIAELSPPPPPPPTASSPEKEAVETPPSPVEQAPPAPAKQTPPAPAKQAPPPVIEAPPAVSSPPPATRTRDRVTAPVRRYNVPRVIPPEGLEYKIRWGDTLWDIADVFYRNPWRFRALARYNGIANPNRIVSGTTIEIPPR